MNEEFNIICVFKIVFKRLHKFLSKSLLIKVAFNSLKLQNQKFSNSLKSKIRLKPDKIRPTFFSIYFFLKIKYLLEVNYSFKKNLPLLI